MAFGLALSCIAKISWVLNPLSNPSVLHFLSFNLRFSLSQSTGVSVVPTRPVFFFVVFRQVALKDIVFVRFRVGRTYVVESKPQPLPVDKYTPFSVACFIQGKAYDGPNAIKPANNKNNDTSTSNCPSPFHSGCPQIIARAGAHRCTSR